MKKEFQEFSLFVLSKKQTDNASVSNSTFSFIAIFDMSNYIGKEKNLYFNASWNILNLSFQCDAKELVELLSKLDMKQYHNSVAECITVVTFEKVEETLMVSVSNTSLPYSCFILN